MQTEPETLGNPHTTGARAINRVCDEKCRRDWERAPRRRLSKWKMKREEDEGKRKVGSGKESGKERETRICRATGMGKGRSMDGRNVEEWNEGVGVSTRRAKPCGNPLVISSLSGYQPTAPEAQSWSRRSPTYGYRLPLQRGYSRGQFFSGQLVSWALQDYSLILIFDNRKWWVNDPYGFIDLSTWAKRHDRFTIDPINY